MKDSLYCVEKEFTVEFYDVDSMNVVWHGNYVKFMEVGRCALLDELGYGYKQMVEDGYAFPVVSMNLKYIKSLYFSEKARICSYLMEYENCLKIKYEIYNSKGELCTKADTTQMALRLDTNESCFVSPERMINRIEKKIKGE